MTLYPLSSDNNNSDPYPQYLTQNEADMIYAAEPYAENLAQDAEIAAFNHTNNVIATHIAANNPHNITPDLINAADKTHTHYYKDITDKTARWKYSNPTFGSGWSAYRSTAYKWAFRELAGTLVAVNGLVKRVASSNNTIFSFHSMYAPPSRRLFSTWGVVDGSVQQCRVDVTEDGQIILVYPVSTAAIEWLSLDGLIWFNNQ